MLGYVTYACEMLAVMYLQQGPLTAEYETTTHRTHRMQTMIATWGVWPGPEALPQWSNWHSKLGFADCTRYSLCVLCSMRSIIIKLLCVVVSFSAIVTVTMAYLLQGPSTEGNKPMGNKTTTHRTHSIETTTVTVWHKEWILAEVMYLQWGPLIAQNKSTTHRRHRTHR